MSDIQKPDLGVWFVGDMYGSPRDWRVYPQCHEVLARRWAADEWGDKDHVVLFWPFTMTVQEAMSMSSEQTYAMVDKAS